METTTSFDLNRAVQQWRENLGQSPAFRGENLNELESHLCDSIATLQTCGLSAEEAFMVAATRIGKGNALEPEFGKVNGQAIWIDRLFWMLIGYQVWGFVSGAIGLVTGNALLLGLHGVGYDFKSHGHTILVALFTLVHLAGFAGSLALCWWLFCRKGQRFGRWLNRLLYRRATWVLAFVTLYLLSLSIPLISGGTLTLLFTAVGRETVGEIALPQSYSSIIMHLTTPVVFIGLTLFLARKRLRLANT
jgi:hypothetical protein